MNPNFKRYQSLIFILGILGALFLTVYQNSVTIMYPNGVNSFSGIFNGLALVFLIIGIFLPLKSLKGTLSTIGISLLLILSLATVLAGLLYAYNLKTDEFLIYFLLNALTVLVYVLGAVLVWKLVLLRSGLVRKEIVNLILTGIAGLLIGYSINFFSNAIESIQIWYAISTLLILFLFISRGEQAMLKS